MKIRPLLLFVHCLAATWGIAIPARAAELSEGMAQKLADATVYIEAQVVLAQSDWDAIPAQYKKPGAKRPQGTTSGSGFLISKEGLIVTNAHVIDGLKQSIQVPVAPPAGSPPGTAPGKETREWHFVTTEIKVVVRSGEPGEKTYTPHVVKVDKKADLALLHISPASDAAPLAPLSLRPAPQQAAGAGVFMAGFPGGKVPAVAPFAGGESAGALSAAKNPRVSVNSGNVTAVRENDHSFVYQLDIRANPGNSGGPITDESGAVVGILNAGLPNMQSINYAIPVRYLKAELPDEMTKDWPQDAADSGASGGGSGGSGDQSYDEFKSSGTFKIAN